MRLRRADATIAPLPALHRSGTLALRWPCWPTTPLLSTWRDHGWVQQPHGQWELKRPDGVFSVIDLLRRRLSGRRELAGGAVRAQRRQAIRANLSASCERGCYSRRFSKRATFGRTSNPGSSRYSESSSGPPSRLHGPRKEQNRTDTESFPVPARRESVSASK